MKSVLLFIFLAFNVYQFKIANIELTLIVDIILLITLLNKKISNFNRTDYSIILFSIGLIIYSVITSLVMNNWDLFLHSRNIRILTYSIFLVLLTKNMIISKQQFIKVFKLVLFLNVLSIIIQYILPETKIFFSEIIGYDKKIMELRSFGLFSSYDYAGFYSLLCLFLFSFFPDSKNKIFTFFGLLFSLIACFQTSRLTMILAGINIIMLIYFNRKKIKLIYIAISLPLIYYIFLKVGVTIVSIIIMSVPYLQENTLLYDSYFDSEILQSYGQASADVLLDNMLVLPDDQLLLFGEGIIPVSSDIGYIHLLFLYGIFGSIFIIGFYLKYIVKSLNHLKYINEVDLFYFYLFFSVLLFIYNYKLTFITASGTHELFIILVIFINNIKSNNEHKLYFHKL